MVKTEILGIRRILRVKSHLDQLPGIGFRENSELTLDVDDVNSVSLLCFQAARKSAPTAGGKCSAAPQMNSCPG